MVGVNIGIFKPAEPQKLLNAFSLVICIMGINLRDDGNVSH